MMPHSLKPCLPGIFLTLLFFSDLTDKYPPATLPGELTSLAARQLATILLPYPQPAKTARRVAFSTAVPKLTAFIELLRSGTANTVFIADTTQVELFACAGDSAHYNGLSLAAGSVHIFTNTNQQGGDSVVAVKVTPLPRQFVTLKVHACPGQGVAFDGGLLYPGERATAVFKNQYGCDSTVTSIVLAYPTDTSRITLLACENGTASFNGQQLAPGTRQTFIFTNNFGCDSVVYVSVNAYPAVSFGLSVDPSCWNAASGTIEIEEPTGSTPPYEYSLDGVIFQKETHFGGLQGGWYTVRLRDTKGCIFSKKAEVPLTGRLSIIAGEYALPCHESSIILSPEVVNPGSGPLRWHWHDGSTDPWCAVTQAGTYCVQASDDCSTEKATFSVSWGNDLPPEYLYVPNAFSPNGDGINETFRVYPLKMVHFQAFQLKIFDRWGNQVFSATEPDDAWDGTYRGKQMDSTTYVWWLKTQILTCGQSLDLFLRGDLTLLR